MTVATSGSRPGITWSRLVELTTTIQPFGVQHEGTADVEAPPRLLRLQGDAAKLLVDGTHQRLLVQYAHPKATPRVRHGRAEAMATHSLKERAMTPNRRAGWPPHKKAASSDSHDSVNFDKPWTAITNGWTYHCANLGGCWSSLELEGR